ncbi:hypothetical protein LguiA_035644 [Lonicera macranthoides]
MILLIHYGRAGQSIHWFRSEITTHHPVDNEYSDSAEKTNASETNSHKAVLPSSSSSFTQHSPSPCLNRSLTKQSVTLSNSLDDDGDGEAWDLSSEENYIKNQKHFNDSSGLYSPANSNQFIAVHRPPVLNVQEALNWENMADDEPFQSWEARADAKFETAIAKNNDEKGIHELSLHHMAALIGQDSSPCTPAKLVVSPPYGSSHISMSSHDYSSKSGLVYLPFPVQTRVQRQKKGTTLSLNKKNKFKKALIKEKKKEAVQSNSFSSSHPLYQWKVYLQDKKKRDEIVVVDHSVNVAEP